VKEGRERLSNVPTFFSGLGNVKGRKIEKPSRFHDRQSTARRWKVKEGKHITLINQPTDPPAGGELAVRQSANQPISQSSNHSIT
jgi:hypothetical protein